MKTFLRKRKGFIFPSYFQNVGNPPWFYCCLIASYLISYQRMKRAIGVSLVSKRCQLGALFSFLLRRTLRGSYNLVKYWLWEIFYYFYCCCRCRGNSSILSTFCFSHLILTHPFYPFSLKRTNSNCPSNQAFIWSQVKYFVSIAISIFCANALVTLSEILLLVLFFLQLTRDNKNILEYKSLLKYYR